MRAVRRGLSVVGIGGVAMCLAFAAAATAATPDVRIVSATAADGNAMVVVEVELPSSQQLDVSRVTVRVAGQAAPATLTSVPRAAPEVVRTVLLVIDTSGSMQGPGLTGAVQAARSFIAPLPADVRVGLLTFASQTKLVVSPTRDRASVDAGLGALNAAGETRLYDGLAAALTRLGSVGERHVLVLSDGGDTLSTGTLASVTGELKASGVKLDAVAFRTSEQQRKVLQQLAQATGGTVVSAADAKQVAAAFESVAQTYKPRATLDVALPAGLKGVVPLEVRVETPTGALVASADITIADRAPAAVTATPTPTPTPTPTASTAVAAPPATRPAFSSTAPSGLAPRVSVRLPRPLVWAAVAMVAGLFILFVLLLDLGATTARRRRRMAGIQQFTINADTADESAAGLPTTTGIAAWPRRLARSAAHSDRIEARLIRLLSQAGAAISPEEFVLVIFVSMLAAATLIVWISGIFVLGAAIGLPVGALVPILVMRFRAQRRRAAFIMELPETLQLVAGALRSGFSLGQALDSVVKQGAGPAATEFGRALAQARLGVPVEEALEQVGERMQSDDFQWVVMAIGINRDVGGNLAEVLETVAETLRERERLRRHVRALSAEGRLSSYILTGMPIVMGAYLFLVRPDYVRPLYTTSIGVGMSISAVLMVAVGWIWMRKLVQSEM
ncbi:MAG: type II secretion system F family protein [Actinomycetota bacterium]